MANALTGDFDLVAEFAVTAADRVLAAMHRDQRFPHTISARIDDTVPSTGPARPSMVSSVTEFGDAVVNHNQIGNPIPISGQLYASSALYGALDPVVNAGIVTAPVIPSLLKGRAQLQLSPPQIQITDRSGENVTIQVEVRSRYFPDPHTSPLAEFIHGELQITAAVNQIASQAANVIDVDIKSGSVIVNFTALNTVLSAEDTAAIEQFVRNALQNSFLPSTATLPSNIEFIQFKTLAGPPGAIAVLLNTQTGRGNASSFNNLLLGGADDFALAVGKDFLLNALQPVTTGILNTQIPPFTISISLLFGSIDITYNMTLNSVTVDLEAGDVVLTIQGHAHTGSSLAPDFDFTVKQNFSLTPDGDTANLAIGDISVDTSSWVVDLFKSRALPSLQQARDQALANSNAAGTVRQMLSANGNLGGFLRSLLSVSSQGTTTQAPGFVLSYTSIDIVPSGLVLHGSLAMAWPPPHVEFQEIPGTPRGPGGAVLAGNEYSALNAWIPGGSIGQFEWSNQGQPQPFDIEKDKFILLPPPPEVETNNVVYAYSPLCLTVRGTRPPTSGGGPPQPVSGSVCGFTTNPIVSAGALSTVGALPMIALAQPDPQGLVRIVAHTAAEVDLVGTKTPNLMVHFADEKTISHLDVLRVALQEGKRSDAVTSIVVVLGSDTIAKAPYRPGIIYTEDQDGIWRRIFGIKGAETPLTVIINPKGHVVWQHPGALDFNAIHSGVQKHLVAGGRFHLKVARTSLRLGQPAPNFLFDYSKGNQLTLRKLAGRAVTLVFWRSSVKPSIDAVVDLQTAGSGAAGRNPVLIAVNDGDSPEVARKAAADNGLSAVVVVDPRRDIASAYGVTLWPTIVSIDAQGLVQGVCYGRH